MFPTCSVAISLDFWGVFLFVSLFFAACFVFWMKGNLVKSVPCISLEEFSCVKGIHEFLSFFFFFFWTLRSNRKGPMKLCLSVLTSVLPSVCAFFLELFYEFFLNFVMVLETHIKLLVTGLDFPGGNVLPPKLGNCTKNGQKTRFFEFIEKFGRRFVLNLFYNKNWYYLLCSRINPIFGKIFIPKIWAKMFSTNQIARFFNRPFFQNKSM